MKLPIAEEKHGQLRIMFGMYPKNLVNSRPLPSIKKEKLPENLNVFMDWPKGAKSYTRESIQKHIRRFTTLSTPKGYTKRKNNWTNYFIHKNEFKIFIERWEKFGLRPLYYSRNHIKPFLSITYNKYKHRMLILFPQNNDEFFVVSL